MSWKDTFEPILTQIPSVQRPEGHVPFKQKMGWTAGILILYMFLTNVPLFGLATGGSDFYSQFRTLLAGSQGSLLQLGIGPIVTASIVLQLLGGSGLLGIDKNDPRDQMLYQGLQKVLVVAMIFLTGIPMVFMGDFLPADTALGQAFGIGTFGVNVLLFLQIALGGILILFMDEIVSKWGVGSGIGLFIVAGVSQKLVGGILAFQPLTPTNGILATWMNLILGNASTGTLYETINYIILGPGQLLAIVTTLLIFWIVVYAESTRVQVPLSHANVKGARGKFPLKLIYASVLPMILVRALQANIQFFGRMLNSQFNIPAWLGVYANGQPVSGLMYYLAPIYGTNDWMWFAASTTAEPWQILIRISVDLFFMVVGGAVAAIFWVETADMGPRSVAEQIHQSGMQIPGFRRNPQVVEKVMERYVPGVTVIGGALVGVLAVAANMFGAIGGVSGTGLLLAVSITYKLYEEIAEEKLKELHPMMKSFF